MTTLPENRLEKCPRCGAPFGEHAQFGFCSRCAATVSLREPETAQPSEDELAAVLPRTTASSGSRPRFGDYELLEEIARGGMGVVYRARQRSLNRIVAVKMLLFAGLAAPDRLRRFQNEAAATAALEHANIVRLLDVGEHEGQPFIAMEFITGTDMAQLVRERPLAARQAAGYLAKIARAVEFAHQRGVLHRDLKSSNVLVDAFDEPRVTDFGLARNLADDSDLTVTGQTIGSPNFMPPEQASGDLRRMGPASDVYGLGAILYHLLTGRPPFLAETFEATLAAVREREPVPPRQLNEQIPRDLETICLKCLEKEPSRRYQTAQELADELNRFLKDEPITARPVTRFEHAWRWCRRKPALATAYFLLLVLLLVILIGSPLAALRINQARQAEVNQRQRAEAEAHRARLSAYASDMLLAQQALEKHNRGRVLELLEKHRPTGRFGIRNPKSETPHSADLRSWEWRYFWNQTKSDELFTLASESNAVSVTAWSPEGERIATAAAIRGTNSSRVKISSVAECRALQTFEVQGQVSELRFLGRDELLVIGSRDLAIRFWNSATGRTIEIPTGEDSLGAVTLSDDGRTLAATGKAWVGIWDLATQQEIAPRVNPPGILIANDRAIALSADGRRLAYNNFLGTFANSRILLAHAATGSTLVELAGHKDRIERLAISPDRRLLASGSLDGIVKLWDVETKALRFELTGHSTAISALSFSPDGKVLATGSWDQQILLWDTSSGEQVSSLRGHTQAVTSIAFSPDGELISSSSRDGTVRVWKTTASRQSPAFRLNEPRIFSTQFSPTADSFWTFDGRFAFTVWDPTNLTETASFPYPDEGKERIGTGPNGLVAFQLARNRVGIYITSPFRKLNELPGSANTVRALAFSRDGKLLAVARDDWPVQSAYTIGVWDWAAGKELTQLQVRSAWVAGMGFSRDNELIGVGYQDGLVEVWHLRDSKRITSFQGASERANRVLFLSDQRRVVCASGASGIIRIWDLQRQIEIPPLSGQVTAYSQISESLDGRRLAASGCDGTITIWDLESYAEVATLRGHKDCVLTLAFLPDGNTLTSVSAESMCIWRATPLAETDASQRGKRENP